ncbi:hypothetical protein SAMN04489708_14623 [Paracidovorax cattleyae]|uniref:Uncharacterized protein n=1 Tax=Paracidovorax cattleyae TaxID=80868 RepID=A0A1H0WQH4_9BURK|nr:hypothetical protein SAMN04489708_14623 [Paracidovorax cattleyae]
MSEKLEGSPRSRLNRTDGERRLCISPRRGGTGAFASAGHGG